MRLKAIESKLNLLRLTVLDVRSHPEASRGRAEGNRVRRWSSKDLPVCAHLGSILRGLPTNDMTRIDETLSQEILTKMHAPGKSQYPVLEPNDLLEYDAVLFGIPTRYGNFPTQWKAFWDKTGDIWVSGGYWGKHVGLFVSTGTQGGGQESTALASMSTLTHHGMVYIPLGMLIRSSEDSRDESILTHVHTLGYKSVFAQLSNLDEVHGGSAWGAGTFAVSTDLVAPYRWRLNYPLRQAMDPANLLPWSFKSPRFRVGLSSRLCPRPTNHNLIVASQSPKPLLLLRELQSNPISQHRMLRLLSPTSLLGGNKVHKLLQKRRARGRVDCLRSAILYNTMLFSVWNPFVLKSCQEIGVWS